MTAQAVPLVIAMLVLAMLFSLWRLVVGPSVTDRVLALDTLYINALALLIVIGIYFETALYFESALVVAIFGFVGTVAYCAFLLRRDIVG